MKRSPRPKTQPVVQMWMWRGIVINGMILTVCIFCTYLIALHAYAGAFLTDDITDTSRSSCSIWPSTGAMTPSLKLDCTTDDCKRCITTSIRRARTTAFIALVYAENFRAYCSRSFENGVWVKPFSNMTMNKAIIFAQLALYFALFCPGLNESVLGLYVYEIHGFGWFLAVMGSLACLVGCEIYKKIAGQFIKYEELADFKDPEDEAGPDAVKIDVQ